MRGWMLGVGGALLTLGTLFGCSDGSSDPAPVYETIQVVKTTTTKSAVDVEIAPGGLTVDFPVPADPAAGAAVVEGLSFDFAAADAEEIDARLAGKPATLSFGDFTGNTGPFEIITPDGKLTGTATLGAAGACSLKVLTADVAVGTTPFSVDEVIALETLVPEITAEVSTQTVVVAPTMLSGLLKSALQKTAVAAGNSVLRKAAGGSVPPPIDASQYRLNDKDIQTRIDAARAKLKIKRLNGQLRSSTPKNVPAAVMASKGVALDIDADPETGVIKVNVVVGDTILDLSTITLQQDPALVVKTFKTEITEIVTRTNPGTGKVEQVQTIVISDGAGNKLAEMTVALDTVSTVVNGKTETRTVATLTGTTQSGATMSAGADVTKLSETVAGKLVETQVVTKNERQTLSTGEKREIVFTETQSVEKNSAGAVLNQNVVTNIVTTEKDDSGSIVKVTDADTTTTVAIDPVTGTTTANKVVTEVATEKAANGTVLAVTETVTNDTTTVATDSVTGTTTENKVVTEVATKKDAAGTVLATTETALTESKSVSTDNAGAKTETIAVSETTEEFVVTGGTAVLVSTTVVEEEVVTTVTAPDANGLVNEVETITTNQVITDETTGATTETTVTTVNTETAVSETTTVNTTEVKEVTGSTTPTSSN